MTNEQKNMIEAYRRKGVGYKQIAKELGLSPNSVKSFCRRNHLSREDLKQNESESSCEQCGNPIQQLKGRKRKRFCSDKCRNLWWNSHLDQVKRKAVYEYVCPICGKAFSVYGNAKRKYCSHACYLMGRFGDLKKSKK